MNAGVHYAIMLSGLCFFLVLIAALLQLTMVGMLLGKTSEGTSEWRRKVKWCASLRKQGYANVAHHLLFRLDRKSSLQSNDSPY